MPRSALVIYESARARREARSPAGVVLEHPTGAAVEWRIHPDAIGATIRRMVADVADLNHWWVRVPSLDRYGLPPEGIPPVASYPPNGLPTPREWMTRVGTGDYTAATVLLVSDDTTVDGLYSQVTSGDMPTPTYDANTYLPNRFWLAEGWRPGQPQGAAEYRIEQAQATVDMLMKGIVGWAANPDGPIEPMPIRAPVTLGDAQPGNQGREGRVRALVGRMEGRA